MRKLIILLYVCIIILTLTACWNYREVDRLTIVAGFAIDKTDNGNYLLTFEVVDMHEAGKEGKVRSVLIETEGETLLDAARNTISKNFPKLYFGHATIAILSKEVARESLLGVIDFICRDAELRLDIHLFVSEGETAGEILKAKALTTELLSFEINNILDEVKSLSKAIPMRSYEFVNLLGGKGVSGMMTSLCTVENNNEKVIKLCGTAIFNRDKLQGFINGDETKTLSFIIDEVKGGVIVAKVGPKAIEDRISLEISESKTKIKPVYKDNKLSIEVNINTSVFLDEHASKENYNDEEGLEKLKKIAEKQLKDEIESLIKKVQTEFGSDIFGFGYFVYKNIPKVWKQQEDKWDEVFKNLEVKVEPKIEILHTSLLSKPVKIGK